MERVAFLIEETGARLDCLLNPDSVVFRREAALRRRTLLGQAIGDSAWSDDVLIAGGGGLSEMQLDLLFDTSLVAPPTEIDNVQVLTSPFWSLAEHTVNTQGESVPRLARFIWGKTWNVLGVVAAVAERFEHFLPNGAPQRSWMRMCFVRVADPKMAAGVAAPEVTPALSLPLAPETLPLAPTPAPEATDVELVETSGVAPPGRLDQVAFELTGDPMNWRKLAALSGIDEPLSAAAGVLLRVPTELLHGTAK